MGRELHDKRSVIDLPGEVFVRAVVPFGLARVGRVSVCEA